MDLLGKLVTGKIFIWIFFYDYFSQDCTTILQEELDQLEIKDKDTQNHTLDRAASVEQLLSPTDENVGIFSRIEESQSDSKETELKTEQTDESTRVSN